MNIITLDHQVSVSGQVWPKDLKKLSEQGVNILVCNRPDHEVVQQPSFEQISEAAQAFGIEAIHLPFTATQMHDSHCQQFMTLLDGNRQRIHAYCRTANRSTRLWAAARIKQGIAADVVITRAKEAGIDISNMLQTPISETQGSANKCENLKNTVAKPYYDVVVVGAGSGGISVSASLLKRNNDLRIVVIDPAKEHFYQPGWTMVGGGVFNIESTRRNMHDVIPSSVSWIQKSVAAFSPEHNKVHLDDGSEVYYRNLIIAPGLKLHWDGIEGLSETLGKNGVTSNYRYDLAPYTWHLVKKMQSGQAIFTQPPMPIKCAGAPQKAMYLSADYWLKHNRINNIDIDFCNAGGALFGVDDYIPALMTYVKKYHAKLRFSHTLTKINGETREAWFKTTEQNGQEKTLHCKFDMIHVCPPQCAPDFIRTSELVDQSGWLDVDRHTLRHTRYENIWGLGDVINTPNAKTLAAVRKQAPVVAQNICEVIKGGAPSVGYDGYGSCPLTVERGKIVLAEFGYGGKLIPTFPKWVNTGTEPTKRAWFLKANFLPPFYWHGMLKGHEWLAGPKPLTV